MNKLLVLIFAVIFSINGISEERNSKKYPDPSTPAEVKEAIEAFKKAIIQKLNGGSINEEYIYYAQQPGWKPLEHEIALAVMVTVLDPGGAGGKTADTFLAVFSAVGGKYVFRDMRRVGGRDYREAELVAMVQGSVQVNLKLYAENDPSCCPSKEASTGYDLTEYMSLEEGGLRIK